MAIQIGDSVGDYQVIGFVGSGGMGAVYKIEHVITKRVEAMKVLPIGISTRTEEALRFEREIQVQARLHHPHIAAVYNAVRDSHSIALIMEFVEGESVQRMLELGRLPVRTAVNYAAQILAALAYAHANGVIHRDVSPANIIVTPQGVAKLTDFGLARAATDLRLSNTGVPVGSPWYMSPEQVQALEDIDGRTDIYSMGAVLHEMLTGRKLFEADGAFAIMSAQMDTIPQPASTLNPEVPKALDDVIARALAKDRAERFQNADEFRYALDAATGGIRTPAKAPIALILAATAVAASFSAVLWWPKTRHIAIPVEVRQPVVTAAPGPAPVVPPTPPDVPSEVAKAPPRPTRVRRAAKPHPNLALRITGGVVEPLSPAPARTPIHREPANEEAAAQPKPQPPVSQATAQTPTETDPKPAKGGSRFLRALGKLNPFGKSGNRQASPVAQ